jgi:hypothetical protein
MFRWRWIQSSRSSLNNFSLPSKIHQAGPPFIARPVGRHELEKEVECGGPERAYGKRGILISETLIEVGRARQAVHNTNY